MIKKLSLATLFIATYLSLAFPVFAGQVVEPCPTTGDWSSLCNFGLDKVQPFVRNGVTILFIVAVIAALFFLIFGGIKWITSGGDKAKLETARNTIVAAVIGLILVFSSYFILNIVLEFFGLNALGVGVLKIPTF